MLKKLVLAGGAAALLSSMAVFTPLYSYARCGMGWLKSSASDSMPLEWELKRARQMIADLKPEIESNAQRIALEKVQVARLEKQFNDSEQRLAKTQSDIERLSDDLRNDSTVYTYAGRTYTSTQVKTDLGNRFKRFKTRKATADKLNQMLTARKATLEAAHERMDAMINARQQLEVEVENLQARLGALRVAQTSNEMSLDDSHLSRTRQLLDEIATRMEVAEETMSVDAEYFGEIDLDEPTDENLLDEIASYFDQDKTADSLVSIQLD
ncbi:hypothetical protein Q31b_26970 [Novipirellula aureliae]|uniref:Chromosome partition protein Smc n=1 Tax=Novipirellula aureliae TaxID=2527966 RepID=A0A5C6DX76_9BACT|nr:hypothetical protein [Novipirellula aureliae]TWU41258.1 hypothetical protein Q31b_26970 [Novipirellula aureliae]